MSDRFPDATLDLSLLPPPAVIQTVDYEAIRTARLTDFAARMLAKTGLVYDVASLETDPGVILQEEGAYRETYNLSAINDAAKAVMILYAQGTDQDQLYALLGVRRLTLQPADPTDPSSLAIMEGNDPFRFRTQIALEGTAPGLTGGGYAFVALRASPAVARVSLKRASGGVVNVVLQGRNNGNGTTTTTVNPNGSITFAWAADTTTPNNDGSVSAAAVQAVAGALNDDWSNDPSTGSQLTDIPQVRSAASLTYAIVARAIVPQGPSLSVVGMQSLNALVAATQALALVDGPIPTDALIAAGRVAPISKFYLDSPADDVACAYDQVGFATSVSLTLSVAGTA